MKKSELKKIIKEELKIILKEDLDRPRLTTEQKKQFLESVKSFGKYGKYLKSDIDLVELSEKLNNICKMAEQVILEEADEWFDKITINRNIKELKRISGEFHKTSKEAKSLQERMISLYEDIGHIINRYFEVARDEEELVLNEVEAEVNKNDKFNYNGITWIVDIPGKTQSRCYAITKNVPMHQRKQTIDNKIIVKNKV